MKEKFKEFRFRTKTLDIINAANDIIAEYQAEGYDLTLRQLYYQFVIRDLVANTQKEYKNLGNIINDARLAGYIDWGTIKDRTRAKHENAHWNNPEGIIEVCAQSFALDTRRDQDNYIEVWVEKEALIGIIEQICRKLDVPWFACRGYVSQTAMYEAAKRFDYKSLRNHTILHLGDHDPSGIDMTRDIQNRLDMFGESVNVKRIALNMKQVRMYNPPPNFAKISDSRSKRYIKQFGNKSWELDALNPTDLAGLITKEVSVLTDKKRQKTLTRQMIKDRDLLSAASERWEEIERLLLENGGL